jgi:nucleoside-diphosphate-sugar epimerase
MRFVTGGTGLIGSHLLFELVSAEKKVKALKRKTSDLQQVLKTFSWYAENPQELFSRIEWVEGDMLDYFGLEKLLSGVEEIYHCAAIVSFDGKEKKQMIRNNVEGTANLVNAALENGVKKVCHVSSVSALGKSQNGYPVDELTNWTPSRKVTGYSQSKFFSETEIWRGIEEGLNAVIVNPSIVLGPGNWEAGSSRLFKTVWDGLNFYTKGVTGFVDVKDVAKAMVLLMEDKNFENCKNQRFLLNAENLSYRELFSRIADALGKPRPKMYAPPAITGLAWRAASVFSIFSKNSPAISRETAAAGHTETLFDGGKITRFIPFAYLPVSESITQTAALLKKEMQNA